MRQIMLIFIKIGIFFWRALYALIKLFPTQKKMTFITRQSNEATLDYLLLSEALKKKYPNYKIIILAKKLENKFKYNFMMFFRKDLWSYAFHMLSQMYHVATSKIVFLDTYCMVISILNHKKQLKVIQLWHAIGSMKKFGYALINQEEGSPEDITKIMCMHKNYDSILISSFDFIKDFEEGFRCDKSIVKEIPLPRVDLLLDEKYKKEKRNELLKQMPELKNKKNILYCSTFRKENKNGSKHIDALVKEINFKEYNLLYKPHPLNNIKSDDKRIITNFNSTLDALYVADYVICDYSSMIYEIGLMGLPLYLYAYDWEEYKQKRELNLDLTNISVLFTDNPKKIIQAIEQNQFDKKGFKAFVDRNVKVPKEGCINAILNLVDTYLQ